MKTIRGVGVFVKKGKRFLAVKRVKEDKIFGGMWALPSGQIEKGETLFQTARREVKEETGLDLVSLEKNSCLEGRLSIPDFPQLLIFVHRGKVSGKNFSSRDPEIEEIAWIGANDFLKSLRKNKYPSKEIKKLERFLVSEGLF